MVTEHHDLKKSAADGGYSIEFQQPSNDYNIDKPFNWGHFVCNTNHIWQHSLVIDIFILHIAGIPRFQLPEGNNNKYSHNTNRLFADVPYVIYNVNSAYFIFFCE